MMTRNRSERRALVKYVLAAPIFFILIVAFSFPDSPLMLQTEGVGRQIENTVQKIDNQLFKSGTRPKVTVKGTEEGWVMPTNLMQVTGLDINQDFEIISFKMLVQKGDGYTPSEVFFNTGSVFKKDILKKIHSSGAKSHFHFTDILIKDLKTNEQYIYGDCYLRIVTEIPANMVEASKGIFPLEMLNKKGDTIERFTIDVNDIQDLDKLVLAPPYELSGSVSVAISDDNLPPAVEKVENKGLIFSSATKAFIQKSGVGQRLVFSMRCKGNKEVYSSLTWSAHVINKNYNEPPFLIMPKGRRSGNITLEEVQNLEYFIAKTTENGITRTLKIVQFETLVKSASDSKIGEKVVVNQGANFKEELKRVLATAEVGDEIIFFNALVSDIQTNSQTSTQELKLNIVKNPDQTASFIGGKSAFYKFLTQNIRYPKDARDNNVEGTINVRFIVEKDGSITPVKSNETIAVDWANVEQEPLVVVTAFANKKQISKTYTHANLSFLSEIERILGLMPKWKPGIKDGKNARTLISFPITFKFE